MDILQLLVSGIANGCIYGLLALGFVLIYKASEAVNFAQGDMMMLGAFLGITFINASYADLPFLIGITLAALLLGLFGYLLDRFVLRAIFGQPQFAMVIILTTVALTCILYFFFARTRLGVAMQASSQNQMAAYYMGIPVKRINAIVWALSGVVAAIAGVLFAAKGAVEPSVGLLFGIKAFAAAVIGGLGSLPGALLGGLLVGIVEPFAGRFLPEVGQIAPYLLMLVVLVLRPGGLFAQISQKKV